MGPPPAQPFIWGRRQGQWNSHRGAGPAASLQPAHRSQIYWTSWSGFIQGGKNEKEKDEARESKWESILFLPTSFPLPVNLTLPTSLSALLSSSQPIQSHFNLTVNVRRMPRPIASLMLFIKATGCELPCPWHLNHGTTKPWGYME